MKRASPADTKRNENGALIAYDPLFCIWLTDEEEEEEEEDGWMEECFFLSNQFPAHLCWPAYLSNLLLLLLR